jgi:hypothetical protein
MSSTKPPHLPLPLCLLMAAVFPVHAQTPARLGEIVVTAPAEHLQQTENVVKPHDIAAKRAATSDTAALLADQPGMALQGAGGVSSLPVIHGLADDRLRIKVDGMDLIASCPNHMNPPLSYLDPMPSGSLKVYAGITPVSVGGDSIGGTIVAETAAPAVRRPRPGSADQGRDRRLLPAATTTATAATSAPRWPPRSSASATPAPLAQADNYKAAATSRASPPPAAPATPSPRDEVGSTAYETRNPHAGPRPARRQPPGRSQARLSRTCPISSTPTSAWTCWTTSRSASTCATSASTTGASSKPGCTTKTSTTTWISVPTSVLVRNAHLFRHRCGQRHADGHLCRRHAHETESHNQRF